MNEANKYRNNWKSNVHSVAMILYFSPHKETSQDKSPWPARFVAHMHCASRFFWELTAVGTPFWDGKYIISVNIFYRLPHNTPSLWWKAAGPAFLPKTPWPPPCSPPPLTHSWFPSLRWLIFLTENEFDLICWQELKPPPPQSLLDSTAVALFGDLLTSPSRSHWSIG